MIKFLLGWTVGVVGGSSLAPLQGEEPLTLRYRWTPHVVQAVEVRSNYTQTLMVADEPMTTEEVSAHGTMLWHVRQVEGEEAVLDCFTAEVQDSSGPSDWRGLDFGSGPPLGFCETFRRDARGRVLEHFPAGPEDPFGAFRAVLSQAADTFPEQPVRPGDIWPVRAEAPWGEKETPVGWEGEVRLEKGEGSQVKLVATLHSRVQRVALAPRTAARRERDQLVTVEVSEEITSLSGEATRQLFFDPTIGWPVRMEEQIALQMEVRQTVREGLQVRINGRALAATRKGTTSWIFRPPTDEELVRSIALAIVNGLERHDLDLLFSFHDPSFRGPAGDLTALRLQAEGLLDRFARLEVLCTDLQASLGQNKGLLTFHRQVFAAEQPDGPLKLAAEDHVRLRLHRDPTRWVVVGVD